MKAYIISIGDELLIGQTINTNAAWLGEKLEADGFKIMGGLTVSDIHETILDALEYAMKEADLILLTGGLGPTKDDITKKALADFTGTKLEFHGESYTRLCAFFESIGREVKPSHKEQCYLPANCEVVKNDMGTAPGMWFNYKEKIIVSMPGVPYEMKHIMETGVLPKLRAEILTEAIEHRHVQTAGKGETDIAVKLEDFENALASNIKLAYLPRLGEVSLRLSGRGSDAKKLTAQLDELEAQMLEALGEDVFAIGRKSLSETLGQLLEKEQKVMATAESCTGGLIAHKITAIPGSSAYFKGSIVAYSNEVKMKQLGVNAKTLEDHGAVSEETIKEMLIGLVKHMEVDYGIATSGIAGPGGARPGKPVGTIWVAVGNKDKVVTKKLQLSKYRLKNIEMTTTVGLNMLRKFLLAR